MVSWLEFLVVSSYGCVVRPPRIVYLDHDDGEFLLSIVVMSVEEPSADDDAGEEGPIA